MSTELQIKWKSSKWHYRLSLWKQFGWVLRQVTRLFLSVALRMLAYPAIEWYYGLFIVDSFSVVNFLNVSLLFWDILVSSDLKDFFIFIEDKWCIFPINRMIFFQHLSIHSIASFKPGDIYIRWDILVLSNFIVSP